MPALALALAVSVFAGIPSGDAMRWQPPAIEHGFDLQEGWDDAWRRFQDRHGRPDIHGPLLQPSPELQDDELELAQFVAEHPMAYGRDWANSSRGARIFVHSDDEFTFLNRVRLKERVPMGSVAAFGMRFDRYELRPYHSSLVRLDFVFPDIAGTGAFVEVRPVARFEKPDLDIDVAVGWARPELGRAALRVYFMDPFNNASDALAKNRSTPQEVRTLQRNPSVGLSGELELSRLRNVRAQAYFGGLFPSHASMSFDDEDRVPYEREQSAILGGGWVEARVPTGTDAATLAFGGTVLGQRTAEVRTRFGDLRGAGAFLGQTRERELKARVYGISELGAGTRGHTLLEAALAYRRTRLPEHESRYGSIRDDRSWLGMARATWMPTRVFGLELTYLVVDRRVTDGDGILAPFLTDTNHRLVTRLAFAFNPYVYVTMGTGWDVDRDANVYDQSGMTLTARW